MERRIIYARVCEGVGVGRVVPLRSVVRDDICGICRNGNRLSEVDLLPAGATLTGERRRGQQGPGAGPEVAHMRARVCCCFVEANTEDGPVAVGAELQTKLHCIAVAAVRISRYV